MSEKKNIDRLFQEKFKDFEVTPPEGMWDNIEAGLHSKNRKKKVVPLWYRLSGVAAVLLLGLILSIPFFNRNEKTVIPVVLDEKSNDGGIIENGKISPMEKPIRAYETVADTDEEAGVINGSTENAGTTGNSQNISTDADGVNASGINNNKPKLNVRKRNTTIAYEGKAEGSLDTNAASSGKDRKQKRTKTIISADSKTAVAQQGQDSPAKGNRKSGNHNVSGEKGKGIVKKASDSLSAIAGRNTDKDKATGSRVGNESQYNQQTVAVNANKDRQNNVQDNSGKTNDNRNITRANNAIAGNNTNKQDPTQVQNNGDNTADKIIQHDGNAGVAKVINGNTDGISADKIAAETAIAETATDTVKPANELEDLLKKKLEGEKDKEEELLAQADAKKQKWNIRPQLAPLFYNSMSQGSPIDAQFAGNEKEYDNDLSYGLGINYALTDRISIRTGINTVNLSYKTNNIQFYAALEQQMPNIAMSSPANIVVQNAEFAPGPGSQGIVADQLATNKFSGSLVQKMGYIEVPVEMSYKLLDKRFGIDIIGGVSTLFLNENNVSVVSMQGYRSEVGEAENLNNVHFSTNIGIGFKYRIWKSFEASFEPMFKYQVNTFSDNSGNFRPYFIGLYSGLSFSF